MVTMVRSLRGRELARAPGPRMRDGFWAYLRAMLGAQFWRAQAYLLIRWLIGLPLAAVVLGLLVSALGMIFAPAWIPFVHGGAHLGFWRPHTFAQSLALVPVGLLLLPAVVLVAPSIASAFEPIATGLLSTARERSQRDPRGEQAVVVWADSRVSAGM